MHRPNITLPYVYVKMRDGREFSEKASTLDTVAYERVALKHPTEYGPPDKTPMTWGMFLSWHVTCRTHNLMDYDLKTFEAQVDEAVAFIPENGDGDVSPTLPVAGGD